MPKDNHSVMQLYLDGFNKNFFTFFSSNFDYKFEFNKSILTKELNNLNKSNLKNIKLFQKIATQNIFKSKKIPFRSFEINLRNEEVLGELFCFFILETILLGRYLKVNPFDQPQ